jgi:hypothetical protein
MIISATTKEKVMRTANINLIPYALGLAVGALLAGLLGSAQPVFSQTYSVNIVGYVNTVATSGCNFIANPLNDDRGNTLSIIMPSMPDETKIYKWDIGSQSFGEPSVFFADYGGWSDPFDLPPGLGVVVESATSWTNTFVGEVVTGYSSVFIAGDNRFTLIASKVPQSATLYELAFPGFEDDNVYFFNWNNQNYSDAYSYFAGFGWFDPAGNAGPNGPIVGVGQSFFVQHAGANTSWDRTFTPTNGAAPVKDFTLQAASAASLSKSSKIRRLKISRPTVQLEVSQPEGGVYTVQFSMDCIHWANAATNQSAATWSGPFPGGSQGYYRLCNP